MSHTHEFIGIDIGGSHITAAQVLPSLCSIATATRQRGRVDSHGDAVSIIDSWVSVLKNFQQLYRYAPARIGIAMPGPFDYNKGISWIKGMNKYESLYGLNIRELLSLATGLPLENFIFRNDAEAFLHGEVVFGNIPGNKCTIGVTLGTGLGSAKSIGGITTDVFRAIRPMHEGVAEDYISTRWFQRRYKELSGQSLINVEVLVHDKINSISEQLFHEFGTNLGDFLNSFSLDEEAEIIIIGGNIARCWEMFKYPMLERLTNKKIVVRQSILWEDAALIGAACSWPDAEQLARGIGAMKPSQI